MVRYVPCFVSICIYWITIGNESDDMKFQEFGLEQNILDALDVLGYEEALPVQETVIPLMMAKKDVLVKSKTGSGKTASFAIPVIEDLIWDERAPQCLVLTPTRELAIQIKEEFDLIGAYKRIKTMAVFGKSSFRFQEQDLKQRCHVVIGTPGRILDHLEQGSLNLSQIRTCVLDEADEMLNMGFIDQVKDITNYFPGNITTCLFSATLPEEIKTLASAFQQDATLVEIESKQEVNELVTHYAYRVKEHEKKDFLIKLLCKEQPESCIIFAKTQEHVKEVCEALYDLDLSVDKLHGGMMQEDRIENLNDFKKGLLRILVATDVASRGIDIQKVTHIINYDMPNQKETYVHRIGRSGRVKHKGIAISFVSEYDDRRLEELEEFLKMPLECRDKSEVDTIKVTNVQLNSLRKLVAIKEDKGKDIRKDTMKLYIGAGKGKKMRAGDIVGAICEIDGVTADDIGVIKIQDRQSYVDILNGKGDMVMKALQKKTIKGKLVRVNQAQD